MSSEPRMRGSRFRRQAIRKHASKEKREERANSSFYQEPALVDPSQVSSRTLNALNHLGNQRFALPPFAEHFERWTKDVVTVLADFEASLPDAMDQPFKETTQNALSAVQDSLSKHVDAEKEGAEEISTHLKELASCELELSNLEREYRTQAHESKKRHEQSLSKLRGEIGSLDKRRLTLLRKRPSFLERILGRSETSFKQNTGALQLKRTDLSHEEMLLKRDIDSLREKYERKTKQLVENRDMLKAKLAEINSQDRGDALEVRKATCQELSKAVDEAMQRLTSQMAAEKSGNAP